MLGTMEADPTYHFPCQSSSQLSQTSVDDNFARNEYQAEHISPGIAKYKYTLLSEPCVYRPQLHSFLSDRAHRVVQIGVLHASCICLKIRKDLRNFQEHEMLHLQEMRYEISVHAWKSNKLAKRHGAQRNLAFLLG